MDVVHENSDNYDPEAHVWRTLKFHYIQPWFFICPDCVKAFLKFMAMEAPKYKASFSVSEAVKIVDGPFADFLGTIESIDEEKGKVKVLVSIFGRETPVELDFLQISKL